MSSSVIPRKNSPLAILRDPQRDIPLGERDIRVEDYLNDKIQTKADLKDLDSLIVKVEEQKKILQKQLQDVRTKLEKAKRASKDHVSTTNKEAQEFQRQFNNVQQRLMAVTSSDSAEQATQRMKGPMEKLRKVELARSYVELVKDIGELQKSARAHLPADPKGALVPYTQLKELAMLLAELQGPTEGAAVHLVSHVQRSADQLWLEMRKIMTDEFEAVLQKSKWPSTEVDPTKEWDDCFGKLLDLQAPELTDARSPIILLPMEVLAKTFVQQFRYHFFSDKPTNSPQQLGDYFFEWFIGTVAKWEDFLRENVGPVLASHFRGNVLLAGTSLFIDPVTAFITALLPVLKEKVDSLLPQICNEPQNLSKFIGQLLTFDQKIRERFRYDAGNPGHGWKGLGWDVLDIWFDKWFAVEKDFAWKRYKEIIDNPDTRLIDFESADAGKTKATFASLQIKDLIINVTKQYKRVRRFRYKMSFLIDIQATILDDYMKDLEDPLFTFDQIYNPVTRMGYDKDSIEKSRGLNGLDRLCRIYCSAEHLTALCKEWSNDAFFVSLWSELQKRAQNTDHSSNLAGDMTFATVKDATSQSVGTEEVGSVFDVALETFARLSKRAEDWILRQMNNMPLAQQGEAIAFLEKALSTRAFKSIRRRVVEAKFKDSGAVVLGVIGDDADDDSWGVYDEDADDHADE